MAVPPPEDRPMSWTKIGGQAILWVIDNSESMAAEQLKIADRFSAFFTQLLTSEVDYHIGVTTTDPDDRGVLRAYNGSATGCANCRYLTKDVPCNDPASVDTCESQAVFRDLIQAGTTGSAFEEGFVSAARALDSLDSSGRSTV